MAASPSALAGRPATDCPLRDAVLSSAAAASVGFDWPDAAGVHAALVDEVREVAGCLQGGPEAEHEVGDVLLAACNLARHLGLDPHAALRQAIVRFEARFRRMESDARDAGVSLRDEAPAALEARWQAAKRALGEAACSG